MKTFKQWWYRWARDNAFPLLVWIGSWSVFDWIDRFYGWLDNTLPWRLRFRLKAMWEENKSLCTQLQTAQWELLETKRVVREAMGKMHMPLRGSSYPLGILHDYQNDILPVKTIACDFERYRVSISLDMYAFPHYSEPLLDYMAHYTAGQMTEHMKDHIYAEVKKFYEKEFLGEIDGS